MIEKPFTGKYTFAELEAFEGLRCYQILKCCIRSLAKLSIQLPNFFPCAKFSRCPIAFLLHFCNQRMLGSCSYICQDTSTRRQRNGLFCLRIKLLPVTTCLTTQGVAEASC